MKISDKEILQTLQAGGSRVHKIMDYVYLKSRSKVIGHVMKNGGSKEDGQDVLQESVAAFYSNIINNKYRGESDMQGYIFGIARNRWLKMLNSRNKSKTILETDLHVAESDENQLDDGVVQKLEGVMGKLDEICRELLVAAFYYNYSANDLSEKFDFKNEQVARNKKYKCLKKLKSLMENIKTSQS